MLCDLEVSCDATVPSAYAARLRGKQQVDVAQLLLHAALWTRPPKWRGFALGDTWAFLRYSRALMPPPRFRLRREWSEIDAHQKAVMSDDLGVGATTCLLWTLCGCRDFVETRYALQAVYPGLFRFTQASRRGPGKSPDYIARDSAGNFVVLECKGTQKSRTTLRESIERGRFQKNVKSIGKSRISASLVGGLFVPQAKNPDAAHVSFVDPDWEEVEVHIQEAPPGSLERATTQLTVAKILSLGGLVEAATWLADTPTDDLGSGRVLRQLIHDRRRRLRVTESGERAGVNEPAAFDIDLAGLVDVLLDSPLADVLDRFAQRRSPDAMAFDRGEAGVLSVLGARLRLRPVWAARQRE